MSSPAATPPKPARWRIVHLSVRQRLLGIAAASAVAFGTVGAVATFTAVSVGKTAAAEHRMVDLRERYLLSDIAIATVRGQVYEIALASPGAERDEAQEELEQAQVGLERLMQTTVRDMPDDSLVRDALGVHHGAELFLAESDRIALSLDALSPAEDVVALERLDTMVDELDEAVVDLSDRLAGLQRQAVGETAAARTSAARTVVVVSIVGVLVLIGLTLLAASSILHGLRRVSAAASRLAEGDFDATVDDDRRDEIGALGRAFNATARSLRMMVGRLEERNRHDAFGRQLNEALEMGDTEEQTFDTIGRALSALSADHPAELLIADSSRAHLEVRAEHPAAGAPGCSVDSPFGCVAVRRGTMTTFPDSRALNACPHLRDRSETPCSAVCVPVTFMGRALGVLHATAPLDAAPDADEVLRMTALGAAAGARIGTVRSFERSQLRASTDGLTGLINRRTFESTTRSLLQQGMPMAIVMADLDHFKAINDTHGHETGDRALKLFAEQLRTSLRTDDVLARYGGEEFVIMLPGLTAAQATDVLDRFRDSLAETTSMLPPTFTASFGVTDTASPESLAGLIRRADAALYRAKAQGRNRVVIAEVLPDEQRGPSSKSALERAILENDPFTSTVPLR